jgi:uncharacterized protein
MAIHFRTFPGTAAIDPDVWNDLAVSASPLMEWEYYHALEASGAVSEERGYRPTHLVAYSADNLPIGLAPLYERDRAWVEFGDGGLIEFLTEFTGLPFNRGLVGTLPFTPVPAYQFLHRPDVDPDQVVRLLLQYIDHLCVTRNLATARIYFVVPAISQLHSTLLQQGYVALRSYYYLWYNHEYRAFDDYLHTFKSSRRTKIKRELRSIDELGIDIEMVDGTHAPDSLYDDIYDMYLRTWIKHMGPAIRPFLNQSFFDLLGKSFRHRCCFSVARSGSERFGLALFYHKNRALYGRYWGCYKEVPFLHFATCYYHPIAYAIRHGFKVMDPGFGGDHKLIRGYETIPVYHYVKFYGERQRRIALSVLKQMGIYASGTTQQG